MPASPDSPQALTASSAPERSLAFNTNGLPLDSLTLLDQYRALASEAVKNVLPLMADPGKWGWLGMYLTTLNAAHTAHQLILEKANASGVQADRLGEALLTYMLFLSAVAEQVQAQDEASKD